MFKFNNHKEQEVPYCSPIEMVSMTCTVMTDYWFTLATGSHWAKLYYAYNYTH